MALAERPLRIVILAKAPISGFAKTRLIPALGEDGAARLAEKFMQHTVAEALAAQVGQVELCVTPGPDASAWAAFEFPDLDWSSQGEGDLGSRMASCARNVLDNGESIMLIGTDCPALDQTVLRSAAQSLAANDACLLPVLDGGYALLGLNRFDSSIFSDIPWSTDRVSEITRHRISNLGWSCAVQPTLADIDEPADLARLPRIFLPEGDEPA